MSIPPLLSRSPPPICETSDEDEDAFIGFMVDNELVVDISEGGVILEGYGEKTVSTRCEDTASEDSGLCMGSIGQTQSPCDTSPVSSTYLQSNVVDIGNNCDKSHFSYSSVEVQGVEGKLSLTGSCNYSSGCDSYSDSVLKADNRSSENLDKINSFKSHCNSSVRVEGSTESLNENYSSGVQQSKCEKVKSSKDIPQISIGESISNVCDQSSFITQVDEFIKSETADFDEFQEFQSEINTIKTNLNDTEISSDSVALDETSRNLNDEVLKNVDQSKTSVRGKSNIGTCFLNFKDFKPSQSSDKNSSFLDGSSGNFSLALNDNISEETNLKSVNDEVVNEVYEDDDFSDFTDFHSGDAFLNEVSRPQAIKTELEPWTHWWPECIRSPVCASHLNEELLGNKLWGHLRELDSSPALLYQWSTSLSNCKFLSALNIDSRNILLGPWNRYKFVCGDGLPCDVLKKTTPADKNECFDEPGIIKGPVPDAHFDWIGSGLVNPLDCVSTTLLDLQLLTLSHAPSEKVHPGTLLLSNCDGKRISGSSSCEVGTSKLVNEKLQTLPDLSFMRKPFIVFPRCAT